MPGTEHSAPAFSSRLGFLRAIVFDRSPEGVVILDDVGFTE
jgi:hypothetical protein